MKKTFLTFAVLLAATAMFVTSCSEEDDTCFCTYHDPEDGYTDSKTLVPSEYGVKNCDELEKWFNEEEGGEYVTCK
ncbi:MAG: hypothetical protein IKJ61_03815 [Bacteroidaceae bacterium]|nr:hypothetical protein [Bacteroidaceae bacterium]